MVACASPGQKYFEEGINYRDQEKWDEAITAYTKAIELDPEFAAAYNNRGYAYFRKADIEAALADFTKAIELEPKQTAPYENRAWTYINAGDYDKALLDLQKALEVAEDSSEIELIEQMIEVVKQKQEVLE